MLDQVTTEEKFNGFRVNKLINSLSNKNWKLILLPTELCNFKCSYCYENNNLGQMSKKTVDAVKALLTNRLSSEELKNFILAWFGGEPLLSKDIIYEIHEHIKKTAHKNLAFSSNMTTNGFLLDTGTFRKLLSLNINHYQISLDGDKDFHDTVRCKYDDSGTFDKIWSNLLTIKKCKENFVILLRLHVHANNLKSIEKLVQKIKTAFACDNRFKVFIRSISKLGGDNDKNIKQLNNVEDCIQNLNAQLGEQIAKNNLENGTTGKYVCYAAQPNSLAIRPNGNIVKCTVALNQESNNIGKLNDDGTLNINNKKLKMWINGFKNIDDQLKCPLYNKMSAEYNNT